MSNKLLDNYLDLLGEEEETKIEQVDVPKEQNHAKEVNEIANEIEFVDTVNEEAESDISPSDCWEEPYEDHDDSCAAAAGELDILPEDVKKIDGVDFEQYEIDSQETTATEDDEVVEDIGNLTEQKTTEIALAVCEEQNERLLSVLENIAGVIKANTEAISSIDKRLEMLEEATNNNAIKTEPIVQEMAHEMQEQKEGNNSSLADNSNTQQGSFIGGIFSNSKAEKDTQQHSQQTSSQDQKQPEYTQEKPSQELAKKENTSQIEKKESSGSGFIYIGAIFMILAVAVAVFTLNKTSLGIF